MAAYLHRALSGGIGHRRYLKGYDCGPNSIQSMSRYTGLQFTGSPCLPVFFFRATSSPRFTGGMQVYRSGSFFHARGAPPAAAHSHTCCCTQHNTTQRAGCCGQQPTLAYTPCHVRQENYANLVTALTSKPAVQADIRAMFSDS